MIAKIHAKTYTFKIVHIKKTIVCLKLTKDNAKKVISLMDANTMDHNIGAVGPGLDPNCLTF